MCSEQLSIMGRCREHYQILLDDLEGRSDTTLGRKNNKQTKAPTMTTET